MWLTKDGSKRTKHVLQSSQLITSRPNWQTTNNITKSSTNQDNEQRLITSTDDSQFTWLWWRLPLSLSKRQLMSSQTVLPQDYTPHPDDHNLPTYDTTSGFKLFTTFVCLLQRLFIVCFLQHFLHPFCPIKFVKLIANFALLQLAT